MKNIPTGYSIPQGEPQDHVQTGNIIGNGQGAVIYLGIYICNIQLKKKVMNLREQGGVEGKKERENYVIIP